MVAAPLMAQGDFAGSGPVPVTFAGLSQAVRIQDYTIVELRRFFTGAGVVAVREEIRVVANGTAHPDYELDYLGVEGEPNGSPLWQQWAQTYNRSGAVFFEHGLFKVRDLVKVQQNYTLHDFGAAVRAGRSVRRVVVFPGLLDKAIWLLEVDETTSIPLYVAEYDAQLRLLSEIEAVTFTLGAQLTQASAASSALVTQLPDFDAAATFMGSPAGLVDPVGVTGEYGLHSVKVKTDPLNNRQTLVLGYTDGVDQFFVTETPGAPDAFASLPVRQQRFGSNTIARYRDPALSVLLFWDDGVSFQVAGRGSLLRLDSFARSIYTRALLGR